MLIFIQGVFLLQQCPALPALTSSDPTMLAIFEKKRSFQALEMGAFGGIIVQAAFQ
jgi:hypothetical protein